MRRSTAPSGGEQQNPMATGEGAGLSPGGGEERGVDSVVDVFSSQATDWNG
jgi:hypothetical protein